VAGSQNIAVKMANASGGSRRYVDFNVWYAQTMPFNGKRRNGCLDLRVELTTHQNTKIRSKTMIKSAPPPIYIKFSIAPLTLCEDC
jgi:hypothetical protein